MARIEPQVTQPGARQPGQWMTAPDQAPPNCPPGLEYLTLVDQLLVKQKVELLEAFLDFEGNNKYVVTNSMGQQVYFMAENTDCCTRQFCGNMRPFEMTVLDNHQREVVHFSRPLKCDNCLPCCCLQELEVFSPPGTLIGYVKQNWTFCRPNFTIYAADKTTPIIKIRGPFCTLKCCSDVKFDVLTTSDENVGEIRKQWTGLVKEAFTDADNFGITFPMDLDVKVKATLLGALVLIDFLHFEENEQNA